MKLIEKYFRNIIILLLIVIFVFLSFKKVNSSDTLIPNLEPYPDSLYYSVPAWNFVHGNGFSMKTQNTIIKQQTPPLYGIYLIPFFALFKNIRSFYYANMILLIGTIVFFALIIDKVFAGKKIYKGILIFFLGFFLVTNFYFYSITQLLMAEPITIFLVTLGIYLYFSGTSILNAFMAGQISCLLMMVKLSNIPYAVILSILFLIKFLPKKSLNKYLKFFFISTGIGIIYFLTYIFTSKLLLDHKNLGGTDFSFSHFKEGIKIYIQTLFGNEGIRYLWFTERFTPIIIVFTALIGVIVGLLRSNYRKIALIFLGLIAFSTLFMSFFVVQDIRYIIAILPFYIIFMGFFIQEIYSKTNSKIAILFMLLVIFLSLFLKSQGNNNEMAIITFKKQVGLNLRHREVPWNYEAVEVFNKFTEKSNFKNTYIGTFLPPPFVEIYSNKKYQTLPISSWQEFYWLEPNLLKKIIGDDDVLARYKKLVKDGNSVYITHYYESNVPSQWPKQINELTGNFLLNKVYSGCLGACDIYQLKNKE
ncbi:MAG: hypothetical protein ACD_12C00421G0003 [uncultured bacterium]|nr:MAG: hypothetical protein ACD_12C00421G0003 [uncultured bacterium]